MQKQKPRTQRSHKLDEGKDNDEYNMFTVNSTTNQLLALPVALNGANLTMEIDTGTVKSVMNGNTFT